jgi:anti-anti-sigma regulatory factor
MMRALRGWIEELMLGVDIEKIGEMAVVEGEGRHVRSDAAFRLRNAVTSQAAGQITVIDLSEASAIEGGGLGMLVFLQRGANNHHIQFKLFNPKRFVRDRLGRTNSMPAFDIVTLDEK